MVSETGLEVGWIEISQLQFFSISVCRYRCDSDSDSDGLGVVLIGYGDGDGVGVTPAGGVLCKVSVSLYNAA